VGVVGAPSGGIELVLKQISLPVAQIRVICKNVPQVSMTNILAGCSSGKTITGSKSLDLSGWMIFWPGSKLQ
jgi:hypothetical protein